MPRVRLSSVIKLFLATWALTATSSASARCELPWRSPSVEQVAEYVINWSDIVALAKGVPARAGDDYNDRYAFKVVFLLKSPGAHGDVQNASLEGVRLNPALGDTVARGGIFLLAAKLGRSGDGVYVLNECLELAIATVDINELIAELLDRRGDLH